MLNLVQNRKTRYVTKRNKILNNKSDLLVFKVFSTIVLIEDTEMSRQILYVEPQLAGG